MICSVAIFLFSFLNGPISISSSFEFDGWYNVLTEPIDLKDAADQRFHPYEEYGLLVRGEVEFQLHGQEAEKSSTESLEK